MKGLRYDGPDYPAVCPPIAMPNCLCLDNFNGYKFYQRKNNRYY